VVGSIRHVPNRPRGPLPNGIYRWQSGAAQSAAPMLVTLTENSNVQPR